MAPQPAPSGAPGAGAGKGKLPPWAWLLAAGAGILVGVFLLRRTGSQPGDEEQATAGDASRKPSGAVVEPLTEDMLQALGVQDGGWQAPRYSSSESGNGGGTSGEAEASSSGGFTDFFKGQEVAVAPVTVKGQEVFVPQAAFTPTRTPTTPTAPTAPTAPSAPVSGGGRFVPQ